MFELLNTAAFQISSGPTTWAEVIGAALGVAMVICNISQIHWGWPLAFAGSVLYFFVFTNSKLYAEAALQIFFAVAALWGWWQWLRGVMPSGEKLHIQRLNQTTTIKLIAITAVFIPAIGLFLWKFTDSDVPWGDTLPTVLSLIATWLMGRKYIETWPLWIVVNLISMVLFAYKDLWLTVGLYGLFACMAALGWRIWQLKMTKVL
jgi:nicotinamide mononucleotide transporter